LHDWPTLLSKFQRIFSDVGVEAMDTSNNSGGDVYSSLLKKLSGFFGLKSWAKISINFTLAASHLAYLINSEFKV
jgi:hypothetical protein